MVAISSPVNNKLGMRIVTGEYMYIPVKTEWVLGYVQWFSFQNFTAPQDWCPLEQMYPCEKMCFRDSE